MNLALREVIEILKTKYGGEWVTNPVYETGSFDLQANGNNSFYFGLVDYLESDTYQERQNLLEGITTTLTDVDETRNVINSPVGDADAHFYDLTLTGQREPIKYNLGIESGWYVFGAFYKKVTIDDIGISAADTSGAGDSFYHYATATLPTADSTNDQNDYYRKNYGNGWVLLQTRFNAATAEQLYLQTRLGAGKAAGSKWYQTDFHLFKSNRFGWGESLTTFPERSTNLLVDGISLASEQRQILARSVKDTSGFGRFIGYKLSKV